MHIEHIISCKSVSIPPSGYFLTTNHQLQCILLVSAIGSDVRHRKTLNPTVISFENRSATFFLFSANGFWPSKRVDSPTMIDVSQLLISSSDKEFNFAGYLKRY